MLMFFLYIILCSEPGTLCCPLRHVPRPGPVSAQQFPGAICVRGACSSHRGRPREDSSTISLAWSERPEKAKADVVEAGTGVIPEADRYRAVVGGVVPGAAAHYPGGAKNIIFLVIEYVARMSLNISSRPFHTTVESFQYTPIPEPCPLPVLSLHLPIQLNHSLYFHFDASQECCAPDSRASTVYRPLAVLVQ